MIPLSKPVVTDDMKKAVLEVLDSGRFIKGPRVREFENEFAGYCGSGYGVATSSGTAAIYLALRALGVGNGDEVLVPSHSFIASATPILLAGAIPVFVDIGEDYLMDIDDLEQKITSRTKAVICVHLYGQMCDMDRLAKLKERYGFSLIEDAAQAHGAEYDGKKAGSFGDIACFSFFPSKNMTVAGDGGMIVTDDEELDAAMRALRDHGRDYRTPEGKYTSTMLGFNFRMSEISAAVGMCQLRLLDGWIEKRRAIAGIYDDLLPDDVVKPDGSEGGKHVHHLYVIRTERRDALKRFLSENDIETGIHYPLPIHRQPIFAGNWDLPVTEKICGEILSLPVYPMMEQEQVEYVCEMVGEFFS